MSTVNSKTVRSLLERYGYWFYIIKRIPDTKCRCVHATSGAPDPKCKECLGTGAKIKILKVWGAIREAKERENNVTGNISSTPKICYIKGYYRLDKDDVVVDDEDVFHVLSIQHHKGEKGEFAFTRLVLPYTKSSPVHLIRNFKELLDEYKIRKGKK